MLRRPPRRIGDEHARRVIETLVVVAERARSATRADGEVVELAPVGTIRSFAVGGVVVRIDEEPAGSGIASEVLALSALADARAPSSHEPLAPALLGHGVMPVDGRAHPWLAHEAARGAPLTAPLSSAGAIELGRAFAGLHGARVFDLLSRLPNERPLTLFESFRRTTEQLRSWMLFREADGLGQDLLTLTLSDLQRALRQLALASDHLFLTARRRTLCHGAPSLACAIARDDDDARSSEGSARSDEGAAPRAVQLVRFDQCYRGDAAEDLAGLSIAARLSDDDEELLLESYLDGLAALGRSDPRFVPRYFARRALALLAVPIARLALLARLKNGEAPLVDDPIEALERETRAAYEELARAMNGLRDLGGRARPVAVVEVMAMGRLVAYEEMLLSGTLFHVAITGLAYTGKTEVGSLLAHRLTHVFFSTTAIGRALALVERRAFDGKPAPDARRLVAELFDAGFAMRASDAPPYYRALILGDDVTDALHAGTDPLRGAELLADAGVRGALAAELQRRFDALGLVVEGPHAHELMRRDARRFHLVDDRDVRRARLMSHRPEIADEDDADAALDLLDAAIEAPGSEATTIHLASRPAPAATLEVLWHLLPAERRRHGPADLSGRAPLFP